MYCEECGTQLNDEGECAVCLAKSNSMLEDIDRDEEAKRYREEMEKKDYSKVFISDEEKYVTSIGNGYIENYLLDGTLKKAFLVISSKRAYLKGRCYLMQGRTLKRINEEKTIDLKDINGSGFLHKKNYLFTVLSVLVFVLMAAIIGLGLLLLGRAMSYFSINRIIPALLLICWIVGMRRIKEKKTLQVVTIIGYVFFVFGGIMALRSMNWGSMAMAIFALSYALYILGVFLWKLSNRTWFNIMMPSGNISFDVRFYSIPEMQEFQKRLIIAKNQFEEQVKEVKMTETVNTAAALSNISKVLDKVDVKQSSLTEEIQSAVKLLEQGLISKDEFEQLKKKLLG